MSPTHYIVITPARNEESYLRGTIESMAAQTVRPRLWVLVNDGSSDGSGRVMDAAAKQYDWIHVLHRPDRGFRKAGGGVMETFNAGMALVADPSWEFVVKLDGDVTFAPDYFEKCFRKFSNDSKLGIGGGLVCNPVKGKLEQESKGDPLFHVRGATKIYKHECWDAIGGLVQATGWDTIDELKANMLGWTTRTFPDIKIVHHRVAGGAYGQWPNWVKNGYANYATGYSPLFMLLKCMRRIFEKPYGVAAMALGVGFFGSYLKKSWRVPDPALIRYLRKQQMQRLLGRPSLWG